MSDIAITINLFIMKEIQNHVFDKRLIKWSGFFIMNNLCILIQILKNSILIFGNNWKKFLIYTSTKSNIRLGK